MAELKLTDADRAFMERMFGMEIPAELSGHYEAVFGVEMDVDAEEPEHFTPGIDVLVANVIHNGLHGLAGGWRTSFRDDRACIEVCRFKAAEQAAA